MCFLFYTSHEQLNVCSVNGAEVLACSTASWELSLQRGEKKNQCDHQLIGSMQTHRDRWTRAGTDEKQQQKNENGWR